MEIKAILQKPYTDNERMDFIVQYNHGMGYVIEETETELQNTWNKIGFNRNEFTNFINYYLTFSYIKLIN